VIEPGDFRGGPYAVSDHYRADGLKGDACFSCGLELIVLEVPWLKDYAEPSELIEHRLQKGLEVLLRHVRREEAGYAEREDRSGT
jgi:hypothetical protein